MEENGLSYSGTPGYKLAYIANKPSTDTEPKLKPTDTAKPVGIELRAFQNVIVKNTSTQLLSSTL